MALKKTAILNDIDLVTGLKNRDERTFTILVNRYKSPLFYFIYKIVGNTLDAEDLTMITFTKVFVAIDSYTPDHLFSTWLFRIAHNASIDFMKVKDHRVYGDELISNYIISKTPNPEQILIGKERVKTIKHMIRHSNPNHRKIIILRSIFGYSFREIEQKYGLNVGTARQHMHRSRIFFRGSLDHG